MNRIGMGILAVACVGGVSPANNDCATPTVLFNTGVFAFDTTNATTGGEAAPTGCPQIGHDLWYRWTAPSNGIASLSLCGQTNIPDTNIAVYPGGSCPGPGSSIVCDDDACGLESFVSWNAVGGGTYMLRIGGSGLAPSNTGSGTFTLSLAGPPANDDCSTPIALGTGGGASYDNSGATVGAHGQGTPCGAIDKDLWYTWQAPLAGTATVETCFQTGDDTLLAVYDALLCPAVPELACDDNGCSPQSTLSFPTAGGHVYLIQVGVTPGAAGGGGSFTITHVASGPTGTVFCPGDGSGTACPCGNSGAAGNGCASSVNPAGATLAAVGNPAVSFDTVELQGSGMPASVSALYFQGTTQLSGGAGVAFGDGLRCAGGTVTRLATKMNSGGASGYGQPLGDVPISVRGGIPAGGGTRQYQVWYRNAAAFCTPATFNLSNGYEIAWIP